MTPWPFMQNAQTLRKILRDKALSLSPQSPPEKFWEDTIRLPFPREDYVSFRVFFLHVASHYKRQSVRCPTQKLQLVMWYTNQVVKVLQNLAHTKLNFEKSHQFGALLTATLQQLTRMGKGTNTGTQNMDSQQLCVCVKMWCCYTR